jgi:Fe-S-cluster containining protein
MHPCAECSQTEGSCCETAQVYITREDAARVEKYLGHSDFYVYEKADEAFETCPEEPLWPSYVTRADGTRRVLRRKENKHCSLLGEHGCSLPSEVRPLICRLYPYEYTKEKIVGMCRSCPVSRKYEGIIPLVELDMDPVSAERLRVQLYEQVFAEMAERTA